MSVCEEEASKVFSVLVRGEIEVVDAARKNGIRSVRRSIVDGGRFVLFSSILQFSFGVDRLLIRSDMQSDEVYSNSRFEGSFRGQVPQFSKNLCAYVSRVIILCGKSDNLAGNGP